MLADTLELIERAKRSATAKGIAVSIAVVDAGGHLVALERMDGAGFATPEIAWGKAWTAAAFGASSAELAERMDSALGFSGALSVVTHGRFTPRQGALPLENGGAIGASGGTSQEDEDVVRDAIG